jgi:hypothetical protein
MQRFNFPCLGCGATLMPAVHLAGRTLRCTKCGRIFVVPKAPVLREHAVLRNTRPKASPPPPPQPVRDSDENSIF